jgi:hypothetical protein
MGSTLGSAHTCLTHDCRIPRPIMVNRNLLGLFVNETFLRNESSTNAQRVGLYCLICHSAVVQEERSQSCQSRCTRCNQLAL